MEQLLIFDERVSQQVTLSPKSGGWRWARWAAHVGDGPYVFGGLGLAYLLGWFWSQAMLRQATLSVTLMVLLAIATSF